MRGKVVNNLLDRKQEQKQINDLIRSNMVGSKKKILHLPGVITT